LIQKIIGNVGITYTYLISFQGWLNDEIINIYLCLYKSQRSQNKPSITVFNTQFFTALSNEGGDGGIKYSYNRAEPWTRKSKGEHLTQTIFTIIHQPGHWIAVTIIPALEMYPENSHPLSLPNTTSLHILNGFDSVSLTIENYLQRWYQDECNKFNKQLHGFKTIYHNNFNGTYINQQHDIKQTDTVSCGVSAIMHASLVIKDNKYFATPSDFSYDNIYEIRMYLLHTLHKLIQDTNNSVPNEIIDISRDLFDLEDNEQDEEDKNFMLAIAESIKDKRRIEGENYKGLTIDERLQKNVHDIIT
jgi:Ulp1 family protease